MANKNNNVINFRNLKRKDIRKELSDGVIIYNPNPSQKQEILNLLVEGADKKDFTINILNEDIFKKIIPMLTNITIPEDLSTEEINSIFQDPDDLLLDIVEEIKIVLESLAVRTLKTIEHFDNMPKEELDKIIEIVNSTQKEPELSPKELKRIELERQLKELNESEE